MMLTAAHGNNWLEFTQKAVKEALKMMKMIILWCHLEPATFV